MQTLDCLGDAVVPGAENLDIFSGGLFIPCPGILERLDLCVGLRAILARANDSAARAKKLLARAERLLARAKRSFGRAKTLLARARRLSARAKIVLARVKRLLARAKTFFARAKNFLARAKTPLARAKSLSGQESGFENCAFRTVLFDRRWAAVWGGILSPVWPVLRHVLSSVERAI